jgi:hypothetical protein
MMKPMIHGTVHEEELRTLRAQEYLAHHQLVYQVYQQVDQVYQHVYQQVDQQGWMRMMMGSSCLFLGSG